MITPNVDYSYGGNYTWRYDEHWAILAKLENFRENFKNEIAASNRRGAIAEDAV